MASNPVRTAPVTTVTTVEAIVGVVLSLLVAHHVIPTDAAENYGPIVVAVLVFIAGAVKWQNVTPVVKVEAAAGKLAAEIADAAGKVDLPGLLAAAEAGGVSLPDSMAAGTPDVPPTPPAVTGTAAPTVVGEQGPEIPASPPVAPEAPAAPQTPAQG